MTTFPAPKISFRSSEASSVVMSPGVTRISSKRASRSGSLIAATSATKVEFVGCGRCAHGLSPLPYAYAEKPHQFGGDLMICRLKLRLRVADVMHAVVLVGDQDFLIFKDRNIDHAANYHLCLIVLR